MWHARRVKSNQGELELRQPVAHLPRITMASASTDLHESIAALEAHVSRGETIAALEVEAQRCGGGDTSTTSATNSKKGASVLVHRRGRTASHWTHDAQQRAELKDLKDLAGSLVNENIMLEQQAKIRFQVLRRGEGRRGERNNTLCQHAACAVSLCSHTRYGEKNRGRGTTRCV